MVIGCHMFSSPCLHSWIFMARALLRRTAWSLETLVIIDIPEGSLRSVKAGSSEVVPSWGWDRDGWHGSADVNPPTPLWRWRRAYWGAHSNTKCSMTFVNIAVAISALAGGGGAKTVSHRDQTPKTVSHRDQRRVVFSTFFADFWVSEPKRVLKRKFGSFW